MIRLLANDLRTNIATRIGPLVMIIAVALMIAFGIAFIPPNTTTATYLITSTLIATALILGSIMVLAAGLRRQDYALWQLAGFEPRQIHQLVSGQNAVLGVIGSSIGALLAVPIVPTVLDEFIAGSLSVTRGEVHMNPSTFVAVVLVVTGVTVLFGRRAARSAAHTPVLEVLRESAPPEPRMTPKKWIAFGGLGLALALLLMKMAVGDRAEIIGLSLFFGPVLAGMLAAIGPLVFPRVILGWTSLIPLGRWKVWYLARHNAQHRAVQSSASIVSLLVSISVLGSFIATTGTATNWLQITHEVSESYYALNNPSGFAMVSLLVGGPLMLSCVGTAVVVFISGRDRSRENALLRSSGALSATIIAASILEAVIITVTAFLLSMIIVAITAILVAMSLSNHSGVSVMPEIPLLVPGIIAAIGATLVLLATVIPTAISLRQSVPGALAAE